MPNIEDTVKQKLGIRWLDAKRLVQDAVRNCAIDMEGPNYKKNSIPADREKEVIAEACELFEDLDEAEKDQMRKSRADEKNAIAADGVPEPEWKRKAREHAERREAAWLAQQKGTQANATAREALAIPIEEEDATKVTSIRHVPPTAAETAAAAANNKERVERTGQVRTYICICLIL